MRRLLSILVSITFLISISATGSLAIPYYGAVDLSSLEGGTEFELEFQLLGGGDVFDAEVLIDNVLLSSGEGDIPIDFEDGTLGDFVGDDWNAADTVRNIPGSLDGTGNRVLSLIEDPNGEQLMTIVYRSFTVPSMPGTLWFDYETLGFETGFFEDQFTAWLRDASGEALLIPGVAYEDDPVVLEVTPTYGTQTNPQTTAAPIPEPTTMLLMLSALGGIAVYGKVRSSRHKR